MKRIVYIVLSFLAVSVISTSSLAETIAVVNDDTTMTFTLSDKEEEPKYKTWWNKDGHIYKVLSVDNDDIDLTTLGDDDTRVMVAIIGKPGEGNKINILLSGMIDAYGDERLKIMEMVNLDKVTPHDQVNSKTPLRVIGVWKLAESKSRLLVLCDIKIDPWLGPQPY